MRDGRRLFARSRSGSRQRHARDDTRRMLMPSIEYKKNENACGNAATLNANHVPINRRYA
jgi:hypothetical protein